VARSTAGPIDLRSDTVTRPSPQMRQAMADALVGDDVYSEDPTINMLQERVAGILGKEAALFVPSGVMGNQLCVRTHTRPGDEVLIHELGHILNYEGGSAAALAGVQLRPLRGEHGQFDPADVTDAIRPAQEHFAHSRLVCFENTHNRAGGTVWSLPRMRAVAEQAREHGLAVHLDGARLWNAHVATGVPLNAYCALVDSVSVCFSKGLGAPVGSVIAGSAEFIREARFHRKKYGGAMRQVGILGAACLYGLDHNIERLADDHRNAHILADRLRGVEGISIPHRVESNIVMLELADRGVTAADVVQALAAEGVLVGPVDRTRVRFVTHMDVDHEQAESAGEIAASVIGAMH